MMELQPVVSFLQHFSYVGVFSSIVVSGYLLPVPEEIVLLTIGYLASHDILNLTFAIIVSFFATLTSDIFLYSLAKKDSKFTKNLKNKFHKSAFAQLLMRKPNHIGKAVVLMRFVVGLRFLGPILAGAMNMNLKKFIICDALALLVYTPLFILLGFFFSHSFLQVVSQIESVQHTLFFLAIGVVAIWIVNVMQKNIRNINGVSKIVEEEQESL